MGTARIPHPPAGLPTVPRWGRAGLARIVPACGRRQPHPRRRRGHSARPGAIRSSRGQPTRTGTGFPSPTASNAPARTKMSPAAQDVPARTVCPDHEWAPAHQPPGSPYLRRLAVRPSQPPRAGHRQKQAAPPLRCGAAGVAAPVHTRCSQSVGESSPVRPTPQPQRVVIGRPQLVGYFCPIPHPDDEEADCE